MTMCVDQLDPYYQQFNPASMIHIASPADIVAVRSSLLSYLWPSTGQLPTRSVDGEVTGVSPPCPGVTNLLRCDQLSVFLSNGFTSYAYVYRPVSSVNKLVIVHHGHEDFTTQTGLGDGDYGMRDVVRQCVAKGLTVCELFMPGFGNNADPAGPRVHDLSAYDSLASAALSIFLEPVHVCLNRLLTENFLDVGMCGVSGGGWTTTLCAACDTRIRVSYPVSGSAPQYARYGPCGFNAGDWEQLDTHGPLYHDGANSPPAGTISYLDLYLLGSAGTGRKQRQWLNDSDDCCFRWCNSLSYGPAVSSAAQGCGADYSVNRFTYPSHYFGQIPLTSFLQEFVQMPTYLDDSQPGFSVVGAWTLNYQGQGYLNDVAFAAAGDGTKIATWLVAGLVPGGTYEVSVTYTPHINRASNAPYSVNGSPPILVNQQVAPNDIQDQGFGWKKLGIFAADSQGNIAVTLNNNANGYVLADAVRILNVTPPPPPVSRSFQLTDTGNVTRTLTITQINGQWPAGISITP